MLKLLSVALLSLCLITFLASPANSATITTVNDNYTVDFTPDNGDINILPAEFPQTQAQIIANALSNTNPPIMGNPNGYHNGYRNLGFDDPDFNGSPRQVFVLDCSTVGGCDSGNAPADRIQMPAGMYRMSAEACVRLVIGHELFHHTQYESIGFNNWTAWGADPVEGTARVMQDKVYNDLDIDNGCITYLSEVNNYLNNPGATLWGRSYTTALFWSYLMERLGRDRTEPAVGTDFIREFWQNAQDAGSNRDFLGTLRGTIAEFDRDASLESLFHDFTIANYTKDRDVAALSDGAIYRYIDEQQAGATRYATVPVTNVGTIPPNVGPTPLSVNRWAARYLQADIGDCTGVAGFVVDGDRVGVSLVAENTLGRVNRLDKAVATHFARAILVRGQSEDRLNRLGAVITGLNDAANINYRFACGSYSIDIKDSLTTRPAYVGEKSQPNRFIVRVRVSGPSELGVPSVEGLRPSDFNVAIGADAATVISGAYVQGEYWLTVMPPTKDPAEPDLQDLMVTLGMATDSEKNAVAYQVRHLDQMLVIDRSGSMLAPAQSPKIEAARNAASLYVDSARGDDKLGVVSFSGNNTEPDEDATLDAKLDTMTPANRDFARFRVMGLPAGGMTSIGDGMFKAAAEFPLRGTPIGADWAVLLSDGMENESRFWSSVRANIVAAGIRSDTIALGPLTDQALLQQIANDTGGNYYYVDVSSAVSLATPAPNTGSPTTGAARAAAPVGPSLANNLAEVYAATQENANDLERFWDDRGNVNPGDAHKLTISLGEDKIQNAVVAVNWPDPGNPIRVRLLDPAGNDPLALGGEISEERTHTVYRLPFMDRGDWTLEIESAGSEPTPYVAIASGQQIFGVKMTVGLGAPIAGRDKEPAGYRWGQRIPITAMLTEIDGAIRRARIQAQVRHPDGTQIELPLLDDGNHGDGQADDGVYANTYTRTTEYALRGADDESPRPNGSYDIRVLSEGKSNVGEFRRIERLAFSIYEGKESNPDPDGDSMPSLYESYHPCLSGANPLDVDSDPDEDQLSAKEEWQLGTDPCHPDTDRGGEPDLSEIKRSANPFNPNDDALPRPEEPSVIDKPIDHLERPELKPNSLLIRYPAHPSYSKIRLWRSTTKNGPFKVVAEFDSTANGGQFRDTRLINGKTYWYKLQGIDFSGIASTASPVFSGKPKLDPMPPIGAVVINGGKPYSQSALVKLSLTVDDADVTHMMISNRGDFAGATWQLLAKTRNWTLEPGIEGFSTVFVQYRDKSGNVSNVVTDEIVVRGGLVAVSGRVKPDVPPTDGSLAGIQMTLIDHPEQPSVVTGATGAFSFSNLLPGRTYTVVAQGAGYVSAKPTPLVVGRTRLVPVFCDGSC